jgi:putative photosynthetic complex assembly protein
VSDPFAEVPFPRAPLRAAAALAIFTVLLVAFVRVTGYGIEPAPHSPPRVERDLRFVERRAGGVDTSAGGIDVFDARTGTRIDELRPGADGFIRATLRGLARERMRRGLGPEVPFRLVLHVDGRLTLEDPATDRTIELEAFGPTNSGAFARLLPAVASMAAAPQAGTP